MTGQLPYVGCQHRSRCERVVSEMNARVLRKGLEQMGENGTGLEIN